MDEWTTNRYYFLEKITEARIHGVGYYAFSTDEKERRKQMDELIKRRGETLQAQKQTEEIRKKRDEIMAARVKAARARQRARAGLPPEEPEGKYSNHRTEDNGWGKGSRVVIMMDGGSRNLVASKSLI